MYQAEGAKPEVANEVLNLPDNHIGMGTYGQKVHERLNEAGQLFINLSRTKES